MVETTQNINIIRTKLHRPPLTKDFVPRTYLQEELEKHRQRPLTLVSAPAGYGKSTLVSSWLEASGWPGAWVSLEHDDSDLRQFVTYVLAAIRTLFPEVCRNIHTLLNVPDLPPLSVVVPALSNDLDQIDHDFILVMDDYHVIQEPAVHELLATLLIHPPRSMHMVVVSRGDPPFPLALLRAKGQMTEIGMEDLRFSQEETMTFLATVMEDPIDDAAAAMLQNKTEGWVTGLRLAALTFRHREDVDRVLSNVPENNRYVLDYMMNEVYSQQPPEIREYLVKTSILNRFSAPLCGALCADKTASDVFVRRGEKILHTLIHANLFIIPLDDQHTWYRYHHLFQTFVRHLLRQKLDRDAIDALHLRASQWFATHDLIEEALWHALEGHDPDYAVRLVVKHRQIMMDQEQWHRIERWLNMLPDRLVDSDAELLLFKAWSSVNRGRYAGVAQIVERVEALMGAKRHPASVPKEIQAEVEALRGGLYASRDPEQALIWLENALKKLPNTSRSQRAFTRLMQAISLHMIGDLQKASQVVHQALEHETHDRGTYHGRLLMALCFVHWNAADLVALRQTSASMITLGRDQELPETLAYGRYFQGIGHYQSNDLTAAEKLLTSVVSELFYVNLVNFIRSATALVVVYQAQGRPDQAWTLAESTMKKLLETGTTTFLPGVKALQAELALKQGRLKEALQWAEGYKGDPVAGDDIFLIIPELIAAKIFISQGTKTALKRAAKLLTDMFRFSQSIHNTRFLLETLALQALLYAVQGDEEAALETVERVLILAEPGGFIRLFVDLGSGMACLLRRCLSRNGPVSYIGKILAAFRDEKPSPEQEASEEQDGQQATASGDQSLTELLTKGRSQFGMDLFTRREREVLHLLAQRLSYQEMADNLFISINTTKRHIFSIYKKLGVHSRREAIAKARELGIFSNP